jgi:HSP20 family protein
MSLRKWDPSRDLTSIQERMNQLFDDTLSTRQEGAEEFSKGSWSPPVDIYETAKSVVLKAEIPGISQEEIEIKIEDNVLVLKGARKFEKKTDDETYYRIERSYGSFMRTFTLPNSVDQNGVSASYESGVFKIVMPKKQDKKQKKIKVEVS